MSTKKETDCQRKLQILSEDLEDLQKYIEEFSSFLPIAVLNLNLAGTILDANRSFENLSGYKAEEILGAPIESIFPEKRKIQELLKKAGKTKKTLQKEMLFISKSKEQIPANIFLSRREDEKGNLIGFFLALTDISELKALQKELEKKVKERTRELQEKIEELEKFHKLATGRELKMIELKEEIAQLKERD